MQNGSARARMEAAWRAGTHVPNGPGCLRTTPTAKAAGPGGLRTMNVKLLVVQVGGLAERDGEWRHALEVVSDCR